VYETSHVYGERTVQLHFFRGTLDGPPEPVLGQDVRWIRREEFAELPFPPADAELLAELTHFRV